MAAEMVARVFIYEPFFSKMCAKSGALDAHLASNSSGARLNLKGQSPYIRLELRHLSHPGPP